MSKRALTASEQIGLKPFSQALREYEAIPYKPSIGQSVKHVLDQSRRATFGYSGDGLVFTESIIPINFLFYFGLPFREDKSDGLPLSAGQILLLKDFQNFTDIDNCLSEKSQKEIDEVFNRGLASPESRDQTNLILKSMKDPADDMTEQFSKLLPMLLELYRDFIDGDGSKDLNAFKSELFGLGVIFDELHFLYHTWRDVALAVHSKFRSIIFVLPEKRDAWSLLTQIIDVHTQLLENGKVINLSASSKDFETRKILNNETTSTLAQRIDLSLPPPSLLEIEKLLGLPAVKSSAIQLFNLAKLQNARRGENLPIVDPVGHLVFVGNPGTGKTTVARLVASLYKELGLLSKGHIIETDRAGLVAGFVGQTAIKTSKVIESAIGGVLFIDEAYSLASNAEEDFGKEAIDTIVKAMEDHREDLVVIVAGYPNPMRQMIESNEGLKSRFSRTWEFEDFTTEELQKILLQLIAHNDYQIDSDTEGAIGKSLKSVKRADGFGNGRFVRNLFEHAILRQSDRLAGIQELTLEQMRTLTTEDLFGVKDSKSALVSSRSLQQIESLVGLEKVKIFTRELLDVIQNNISRKKAGLPEFQAGLHMVFAGNPGTGKNTVARLIAETFKELGILEKGHLVETDASGLVAGYMGQTAIKTLEKCKDALGGVLFIDEAYTLSDSGPGKGYGQEAIDTLLKFMEDNRDGFVVIVAGYGEKMHGFIKSNPGLESRFDKFVEFENYTSSQLTEILKEMASKLSYTIDPDAAFRAKEYFETLTTEPNFANGRAVRKVFERALVQQSVRLQAISEPTVNQLRELVLSDFSNTF